VFVLILIISGGLLWQVSVLVGCFMGFRELDALMQVKGFRPSRSIVIMTLVGFFLLGHFHLTRYFSILLTWSVIGSFFHLLFRRPVATMADISATLLAVLYLVFLPMHYMLLRDLGQRPGQLPWEEPGFGYLLMILLVITSCDVAAYYAGKAFGKHLLYPAISPKKTQEGSLAGILAGVLMGCICTSVMGLPLHHGVILSLLLCVVGQLGDLSESLLKRDAGIKDSGMILQGHGGLLDRFDSYIFCGPIAYYYINWVILQEGLAKDIQPLLRQLSLI
jgi:phosphatidate cytidylyltransferase